MKLAYDIETDGFDSTTIHCLVTQDLTTGQVCEYNDRGGDCRTISTGISILAEADLIVAHNGIGYDTPQIKKHFPWFDHHHQIDTLILSRFFHPDLLDIDLRKKWTMMPAKLYGSHSLEAWGYRLKCHKDDFGKQADWGHWSPEMQDYCVQDVTVLVKLWNHFQEYLDQ
ncbi:ribonuclease H-like domain-containing protein [Thermus thermophilus]|uniref:ribonuclease H-like domain-containing protein n=1 Tax=Thermus thermophilus TaxID=274 RepID=UPI0013FDA3BD